MKRKLLLIAPLLCFAIASMGQTVPYPPLHDRSHPAFESIPVQGTEMYKTQGGIDLLLADAFWRVDLSTDMMRPYDSCHYYYDANESLTHMIAYKWDKNSQKYIWNTQELFNYFGDTTETISQRWEAPNQKWINDTRSLEMLDADSLLVFSILQNWNNTQNTWINDSKTIYYRDQDGRDTLVEDLVYGPGPPGGGWAYRSRTRTKWSPFTPVFYPGFTEFIDEDFNWANQQWEKVREILNSFDVNGNIDTTTYISYSGTLSIDRISRNYNMHHQVVDWLGEVFDMNTLAWKKIRYGEATYQDNGFFDYDTITEKEWVADSAFTGWANYSKSTYLALSSDSLQVVNENGLNYTQWEFSSRYNFVFDPVFGFVQDFITQLWSGTEWENINKDHYTFNANGSRMLYLSFNWDDNLNDWELRRKRAYYYFKSSMEIEEEFLLSLKVYPNPASDRLTLEMNPERTQKINIQVLEINGRLIQDLPQQLLPPGELRLTIKVDQLPTGIYILRLVMGDEVISRKWIKL